MRPIAAASRRMVPTPGFPVSRSRDTQPRAIKAREATLTTMWYVARFLAELFGGTTPM
jgi:hypothetical protein